jgi:Tol biopolymer transport system component
MADGKWSAPRDTDLGLAAGVMDPIYSMDGKKLFFLAFAPDRPGGCARERIWCAERTANGFLRPAPIDEVVRAHPTHWTFSVARNGNLYFTSEIEGARGGQDIYLARFAGGKYLAPEELGPAVNSAGKDFCPFIAADESYLVFARLGPETRKADLYISYRKPDGEWTRAQDMGAMVNSAGHDLAPYVSPDGRYLFFVSQRERLNGIYWLSAAIIHKLRPGKFIGGAN